MTRRFKIVNNLGAHPCRESIPWNIVKMPCELQYCRHKHNLIVYGLAWRVACRPSSAPESLSSAWKKASIQNAAPSTLRSQPGCCSDSQLQSHALYKGPAWHKPPRQGTLMANQSEEVLCPTGATPLSIFWRSRHLDSPTDSHLLWFDGRWRTRSLAMVSHPYKFNKG